MEEEKKRLETEARISEAMKIAVIANFSELLDGYERIILVEVGLRIEEKKEWVDMSKPRECAYNNKNGEKIILGAPLSKNPPSPPPVEERGITLRQLRAVMTNIIKRCVTEKWTNFKGELLSPNDVTLYDADKYVIRPFTVISKNSFVAHLPSTAGSQPPRFFVSHWWGESVKDFIACIEHAVKDFAKNDTDDHDRRGGGMTIDTPVWVCAYGNDQWDLSDITEDPQESGFTRAMNIAKGRTITVLDKEGVVFTRVWCIYELHLTLIDYEGEGNVESQEGVWAVYTAHKHTHCDRRRLIERDAVGIISGGAPCDYDSINTNSREDYFPYELIKKSLTIQVEDAKASEESDRVHILNSIIGNTKERLNDNPPKSHDKYSILNDSLRGRFASSASSLRGALKESETDFMAMLVAMSKSTSKNAMMFSFKHGWLLKLKTRQAAQLMAHLPLNMEELDILYANYGAEFLNAVSERINKFKNIKTLELNFSSVLWEEGPQEASVRLAEVLASNITIETLTLNRTNLIDENNKEQWGNALLQNKTITKLYCGDVNSDVVEYLKANTAYRSPTLEIN